MVQFFIGERFPGKKERKKEGCPDMWTIRELKQAGKRHFLRNWVSMVAVCFLLAFAGVAFTQSAEFIHQFDPREVLPGDHVAIQTVNLSNWELLLKWLDIQPGDGNHPLWAAADRSFGPLFDTLTSPFSAFFAFLERSSFAGWLDVLLAGLGIAGGLWFSVWVLGPAAVGARRFYLESRVRDNISISSMFTPFGRGKWWNITKTMLLRSVYLALWTFTIVGFPSFYYSYLMTPYILAENPNLSHREALRLSRRMMRGQK